MYVVLVVLALVGCASFAPGAVKPGKPMSANELVGGAAANVALRLLPNPWRQAVPRFLMFNTLSFGYEMFVDPHHNDSYEQARWDVRDRLVGYLLTEGAVALWRMVQ